ncbi:MAG TPA: hypothetical protein PKY59_17000 [Pyrinomonadaceae bacterium]|nr:hypothetical protein [Pyrinomonadaceae bacterium]
MTRNKREPIAYTNENVVHTIKIIEALEGANFEPVSIQTIMDRTDLKRDKCMRVLMTLKVLGWVAQDSKNNWLVGSKILRFSNRYSEFLVANSMK